LSFSIFESADEVLPVDLSLLQDDHNKAHAQIVKTKLMGRHFIVMLIKVKLLVKSEVATDPEQSGMCGQKYLCLSCPILHLPNRIWQAVSIPWQRQKTGLLQKIPKARASSTFL
jgi:hypothetical protein